MSQMPSVFIEQEDGGEQLSTAQRLCGARQYIKNLLKLRALPGQLKCATWTFCEEVQAAAGITR